MIIWSNDYLIKCLIYLLPLISWIIDQGNHEHLLVFNDVRLVGPEDPQVRDNIFGIFSSLHKKDKINDELKLINILIVFVFSALNIVLTKWKEWFGKKNMF